jgi:hypothetical protein
VAVFSGGLWHLRDYFDDMKHGNRWAIMLGKYQLVVCGSLLPEEGWVRSLVHSIRDRVRSALNNCE